MLIFNELQTILPSIPTIELVDRSCRAVGLHHIINVTTPNPLYDEGSFQYGSRFVPPASVSRIKAIHLSSDPITVLSEVNAIFMHSLMPYFPASQIPWVIFSTRGFLHKIVDLNSESVRHTLDTSLSELTGAWRFYPAGQAPTQILGQVAYQCGQILGFKYASARNPDGYNIVIFTERMGNPGFENCFLEVEDPHLNIYQRIP